MLMMIKTKKNECVKGDIWFNGKYHLCEVDYCKIHQLQDYLSQRKSKDALYYQALKQLKHMITQALIWEATI